MELGEIPLKIFKAAAWYLAGISIIGSRPVAIMGIDSLVK